MEREKTGIDKDDIRRSLPDRKDMILLSLIIVTAFILRMLFISRESLWIDEVMTALRSRWEIGVVLRSIAERDHLPLYYLLVRGWVSIFGLSESTLRSFSALTGALSLIPLYLIGRRFSRESAIFLGVIGCILPVQVYFGQEAKMYSLLVLLSGFSIYLLLEYTRPLHLRRKVSLCLLLITNLLLAYTHYYSYLLLLGELVFISYPIFREEGLSGLKRSIGSTFPVTIPIASFIIWLIYIIGEGVLFEQTTGGGIELSPLSVAVFIPFIAGSYRVPEDVMHLPMVAASILLIASFFVTLAGGAFEKNEGSVPKRLILFFLVLVPAVSLILSLTVMNIFGYRYFLILTPVFLLISAWPLKRKRQASVRRILLFLVIIASLIALPVQYLEKDKDDWRGAVEYIEGNTQEGDVVVPVPSWEYRSIGYYGPNLKVRYWSNENMLEEDPLTYDRIWVVVREDRDDGWTIDHFTSELGSPISEKVFEGLTVFLFSRGDH